MYLKILFFQNEEYQDSLSHSDRRTAIFIKAYTPKL